MRFATASLFVCAAVAAVGVSPAPAAPVHVYGSPSYTPGAGGLKEGAVPFGLAGPSVSDAGAAIGYADKYDASGVNKGARGVRWDASGAATELGNLGTNTSGVTDSRANAINNAGTAAGFAQKYDGAGNTKGQRAVRWEASGTAPTELGTLGTDTNGIADSFAYSINSAGVIVGFSTKYDGSGNLKGGRPVRWDVSGTIAELGTLGASTSGVASGNAFAVNSAGTAVGESGRYDGSGNYRGTRAARWDASGTAATELANLGTDTSGSTTSQAYAVIATGTAVGYADKYDGAGANKGERAVRWDGSGSAASELGNLGTNTSGFTRSFAYDINTAGTAVGHAQKYDGAGLLKGLRAIRWDGSTTAATELGDLGTDTSGFTNTQAFAINTSGIAVGLASDYDGAGNSLGQKAVYWDLDGLAVDLNTLIDPAGGWTLTKAMGISDTGWIAGRGTFDPDGVGGQAAYGRLFVVQLPEPSGLGLLALAGVALRRRRRRKDQKHGRS